MLKNMPVERRSILTFGVVGWLLCNQICVSGQATSEKRETIKPDAAVRNQIRKTMHNDNIENAQQQFILLQDIAQSNRDFVPQLIYYSMNSKDERDAMTLFLLIDQLKIPKGTILVSIVPYLETSDAQLKEQLMYLLGYVQDTNNTVTRPPDFSYYESYISNCKDKPPFSLIEIMYSYYPGEALLSMMRVYTKDLKTGKEIRWAEHVIADTIWKQKYGFLKTTDVEPAAKTELEKLLGYPDWWVRLYAAAVIKKCPAFASPENAKKLSEDENSFVKQFFSTAASQ